METIELREKKIIILRNEKEELKRKRRKMGADERWHTSLQTNYTCREFCASFTIDLMALMIYPFGLSAVLLLPFSMDKS